MNARTIQPGDPLEGLDTPVSILLIILSLAMAHPLLGAQWPPQDHAGADFTLTNGDVIWGAHSNIGNFVVPAGATVSVLAFDGTGASGQGGVEVQAQTITIGGTLTAVGTGFTGGGGGGGGGGYYPQLYEFDGGARGVASYGVGLFDGAPGNSAHFGGSGGLGGVGDGPFAGMTGHNGTVTDRNGNDGGYGAIALNGDITTDFSTQMGSGGGGGVGDDGTITWGGGSGGGGGAGGRGGGQIRLLAATRINLTSSSRILVDGTTGGNGGNSVFFVSGGTGGNVEPFGSGLGGLDDEGYPDAGNGGSGAGGGILLQGASIRLEPGATISSLGGRSQASNGGTVKAFGVAGSTLPPGVHVASGRTYLVDSDLLMITPGFVGTVRGNEGGPFEPGCTTFTLENFSAASLDWTATSSSTWVDVTPPSGTLPAGTSVTVTACINAEAAAFAPGNYAAPVGFTNQTSGFLTRRTITLKVIDWVTSSFLGTVSGNEGGPFEPDCTTFTLENFSAASLDWTTTSSSTWVDLTPPAGTLPAGTSVTVMACINAEAAAFAPGNYAAQVGFTNQTSGFSTLRTITLTVIDLIGDISVQDSIAPSDDLQMPFGPQVVGETRTEHITVSNTDPAYEIEVSTISLVQDVQDFFSENFDDGLAQGWVEDVDADWNVAGGEYHCNIVSPSATISMVSEYQARVFDNFTYEASVRSAAGTNSRFLLFRATSGFEMAPTASGSAYMFGFSGNSYSAWRVVSGTGTAIVPWTTSPYLYGDTASNTLKVVADGSKFYLYINGNFVNTVTDTTFASGYIGLFGYTGGADSNFYFDNITVVYSPVVIAGTISGEQHWYNEHVAKGGSPFLPPASANVLGTYPGGWEPLRINSPASALLSGESFSMQNLPSLPQVLFPGEEFTFDVTYQPASVRSQEGRVTIKCDDTDEGDIEVALSGEGLLLPTILDEQFTTSTFGWEQFGPTSATQYADYDSTNAALIAHITQSAPGDYRIIGWITDPENVLPYAAVGSDHYIRAKFYVYASGQSGAAANEIPNSRMRVANRFAVTALQNVNNHNNADPEATNISYDIRPSTSPGAPSVYRVDLDPIDVPQLVNNPATEGFLRAFEVYEPDPQANGNIGLTECAVGVYSELGDYSTLVPVTQNGLIKLYQPGASDGGDFGNGNISVSNSAATIVKYQNGALEPTGPQPTFSVSNAGVTLDTLGVESDRFGAAAFDVFNDLADQTNHLTRARVEPGKQYKIRFHATSTKASNTQSVMRFRARTIKFQYTASMEVGGATGASAQSNTIAAQALPGIGNQIPVVDRINSAENGGWYNVLMITPMNPDIQPSQPNLYAQDPPGVDTMPANNSKSRRDLQFGFDVIDTFSTQAGGELESGQMTVDRVDIEKYDLVPD